MDGSHVTVNGNCTLLNALTIPQSATLTFSKTAYFTAYANIDNNGAIHNLSTDPSGVVLVDMFVNNFAAPASITNEGAIYMEGESTLFNFGIYFNGAAASSTTAHLSLGSGGVVRNMGGGLIVNEAGAASSTAPSNSLIIQGVVDNSGTIQNHATISCVGDTWAVNNGSEGTIIHGNDDSAPGGAQWTATGSGLIQNNGLIKNVWAGGGSTTILLLDTSIFDNSGVVVLAQHNLNTTITCQAKGGGMGHQWRGYCPSGNPLNFGCLHCDNPPEPEPEPPSSTVTFAPGELPSNNNQYCCPYSINNTKGACLFQLEHTVEPFSSGKIYCAGAAVAGPFGSAIAHCQNNWESSAADSWRDASANVCCNTAVQTLSGGGNGVFRRPVSSPPPKCTSQTSAFCEVECSSIPGSTACPQSEATTGMCNIYLQDAAEADQWRCDAAAISPQWGGRNCGKLADPADGPSCCQEALQDDGAPGPTATASFWCPK